MRPWLTVPVARETLNRTLYRVQLHVSHCLEALQEGKEEIRKAVCFVASKAACLLFQLLRTRGLHMDARALEATSVVCARLACSDVLDARNNRIASWGVPAGWDTHRLAVLSADVLSQLQFDLQDEATWCYRLLTNNLLESETHPHIKACVRSLWSSHDDTFRDEKGEGKQRQASMSRYRDLDAEQEFESAEQNEHYDSVQRKGKRELLEKFTVDSLFSFCIPSKNTDPGPCLRFLSSTRQRKAELMTGFVEQRLRQELSKRDAREPSTYFSLPASKRKKK
jgi:hypothetical protein